MENNENNDKKENSGNKRVKIPTAIISALIIILVILAAFEIWIYFFGVSNPVIKKVASVVPYPAAIVGTDVISAGKLEKNLEATRNFYENQNFSDAGLRIDFTTADGKKRLKIKERRILTKIVEDSIIEQEANRRGIKLAKKDISAEVSKKIEEYGDQKVLEDNMKKLYGWEIKDFEENIVKPDIYAQKLYENMRTNDDGFTKASAKIKQAKAELDKSKDFESVVAKYSEGDSVKDRGDLGWFSYNEMLPEIAQTVSGMKKGETSDIIESSVGYHIIRLEDTKVENDTNKFHVKQIFVRVPTLAQWLSQKEKETRIFLMMRSYRWDENIKEAQFTDKNLQAFEENLEKNSADDVSVMF